MATILEDSFVGSAGNIDGRTPTVTFDALDWFSDPTEPLNLDGAGAAESADQSSVDARGFADIGVGGATDYGTSTGVITTFTFVVKTGANVTLGAVGHVGFELLVEAGESSFFCGLFGPDTTDGRPWQVTESDDGDSNAVTTPVANTEYTGTYVIEDGAQTLTFMGNTKTSAVAFANPALGVNRVSVMVGAGFKLMSILAEDVAVGSTEVTEAAAASDSHSAIIGVPGTATEAASAADNVNGTNANYPVTITEAASASHAQSAVAAALPFATLFKDNFDGSGSPIGRTPDTTFGGLDWADYDGGASLTVSGGYITHPFSGSYTTTKGIVIGDDVTPRGLQRIVDMQFSLKFGPVVTHPGGMTSLNMFWWVEGHQFSITVSQQSSGAGGLWRVTLVGHASSTTTTITVPPVANTEYPATITMTPTSVSLVMFGQTFTTSHTRIDHVNGMSGIRLTIGESASVGYIQAFNNTAPVATPMIADLTAPMGTLAAASGSYANLAAPVGLLFTEVRPRANTFDVTAPMGALVADSGATASLSAPVGTLITSITVPISVTADLVGPTGTLLASGTVGVSVKADLMLTRSGTLVAQLGTQAALAAPMGALDAAATAGVLARFAGSVSIGELSAMATAGIVVNAALVAPMIEQSPYAYAALTAPMGTLLAYGEVVVVVTYEAYATNLKPFEVRGQETVHEVTRYTNFPFNQVLRFKNSYLGLADDGLYLLGGPTDPDGPVEWAWKTAMGDSGTSYKKTVLSVYFGGRIGQASTVTLYKDESDSTDYDYTTPRDTSPKNYRQKFGRGTKTRYFAIGVSGDTELDLDTMEFEINNLTRRI
jgi:hypothetical protein